MENLIKEFNIGSDYENEFWGECGIPSISFDSAGYEPNSYWHGRAWPPLHYWTYVGLLKYGFYKEAD